MLIEQMLMMIQRALGLESFLCEKGESQQTFQVLHHNALHAEHYPNRNKS